MRYPKKSIVLSLSLAALVIIAGTLAGVSLTRQFLQPQQPLASEVTLDVPLAEDTKLFTFGDEAGQTIFLAMINAQTDEGGTQYTLTTASNELQPTDLAGEQLVCAGTRLGTAPTETEPSTPLSALKMFGVSWLTLFDDDSYEVNLWNPSGQYDGYVLASPDEGNNIEHCSHFIDEDV